jgi:hypothetical protein
MLAEKKKSAGLLAPSVYTAGKSFTGGSRR